MIDIIYNNFYKCKLYDQKISRDRNRQVVGINI